MAQLVKNAPAMWETWVQSLGLEDSSGEGKVYPLQYSGLENSMDCMVHGITESWTRLSELASLISVLSKGLSSVFSSTTVQKHQFFGAQTNSLWFSSHICTWLLEKPHLWQCRPSSAKWCFCFEYTIYVCHIFLSKEQVSFNFMAAVAVYIDFEAQEMKISHCFQFILFNLPWSDGTGVHDLSYWMFSSQLFHSSVSPSSGGSLVPLNFLPLWWYHLHIWDYWYFSQQYWFQLVIHPAWHFTWCTLHRS